MIHGHGVNKFVNGIVYEGQWQHGESHGYGSEVYPEEGKYTGYWRGNRRRGVRRICAF